MPSLGADMEVGTVIAWLVKPGDLVKRGDIVAVVDTEKAEIEVEIFSSGVIEQLLVAVGQTVPVGTPLAVVSAESEGAAAQPAAAKTVAAAPPPPPKPVEKPPVVKAVAAPPAPATKVEKAPRPVAPPPTGRLRVSPLAMRVAVERGVDLKTVTGTGPDGAITRADVEKAAAAKQEAPTAARPVTPPTAPPTEAPQRVAPAKSPLTPTERHAAMRRAIAAAMTRSKREIPHYYLATRVDMSRALAWLQAENLKRPVTDRLLYAVLLLKAVALAARQFPELNGFWTDGAFHPSEAIHLGVAVSVRQGGLIAPAIHDVDKQSLSEIMVNLRDLVKRVRAGVLRSSEIADATLTVTSLGEQGVETVFGVIYPPQVGLVGFGKVGEQPWATNGMLGVKPVILATLAADHRASDGHRGGLFLATIERLLQEPEKL